MGGLVLLSAANLRQPLGRKLSQHWLGPFAVLDHVGPTAYCLELPPTYRFHPVFHVSLLRAYDGSGAHRADQATPAVIQVADTVEHEVKKVLRHRTVGRAKKIEYLVMWKEHDLASATWEPSGNMDNAEEQVEAYWAAHRVVRFE